jgi:dTDP-4-dehydrorhamnose 3,5-epimerase
MHVENTSFEGLLVLTPRVFADSRGFFFESYSKMHFEDAGLHFDWVQDNQSHSNYGVVRGLHFQKNPSAQTKLIRVLKGEILDVVVDLRKDQPTFGQVYSILLSSENKKQLLVPKGFAHGFSVLSETADVMYKCDSFYDKKAEAGICYSDQTLSIDWKVPADKMIVSEKDIILPSFIDCDSGF